MKILGQLLCACGFVLFSTVNAQTGNNAYDLFSSTSQSYTEQLQQALDAARANQCKKALPDLIRLAKNSAFLQLNKKSQELVYISIAKCGLEESDWSAAQAGLKGIRKLGNLDFLSVEYLVSVLADMPLDATEVLEVMARKNAAEINDILLSTIWDHLSLLEDIDNNNQLKLKVLQLLFDHQYTPSDPAKSTQYLLHEYISTLLLTGNKAKAIEVSKGLNSPAILIEMLIDNRYQDFATKRPINISGIANATAKEGQALQQKIAKHPESLGLVIDYLNHLQFTGDYDTALKLALITRAKAGSSEKNSPYKDYDDYISWIYNELAYIYSHTGQLDKAAATFEAVIDKFEDAQVSQLINYAGFLRSSGDPQAALEVISRLDPEETSDFGNSLAAATKACAHEQLGDETKAAEYLQKVRDFDIDRIIQMVFICVDREDEAAALYIKRLNDEDTRGDALMAFQRFNEPPHQLPFDKIMAARFEKIRARQDIQDAVATHGKILTFPYQQTYWVSY